MHVSSHVFLFRTTDINAARNHARPTQAQRLAFQYLRVNARLVRLDGLPRSEESRLHEIATDLPRIGSFCNLIDIQRLALLHNGMASNHRLVVKEATQVETAGHADDWSSYSTAEKQALAQEMKEPKWLPAFEMEIKSRCDAGHESISLRNCFLDIHQAVADKVYDSKTRGLSNPERSLSMSTLINKALHIGETCKYRERCNVDGCRRPRQRFSVSCGPVITVHVSTRARS